MRGGVRGAVRGGGWWWGWGLWVLGVQKLE